MPKSAFPLSKSSSFRIRAAYRWRIIKFICLDEQYRLLVAYRTDIERFCAYLGRADGGDLCVVARYEFHGTEGWHVHANCAGQEVPGRTGNLPDCLPKHGGKNRKGHFGITSDDIALHHAMQKFRLMSKEFALTSPEQQP